MSYSLQENFEYIRMDALVSERLTASPRIVDIYGYCGMSILSEFLAGGDLEAKVAATGGYIEQADLHDETEVKPQNNYTSYEKLMLATGMARAIADLHGFEGGVIVHDDIQLCQFFVHDGVVKLNDFNRAEIMLWDENNEEYCRYRNGRGHGNVSVSFLH